MSLHVLFTEHLLCAKSLDQTFLGPDYKISLPLKSHLHRQKLKMVAEIRLRIPRPCSNEVGIFSQLKVWNREHELLKRDFCPGAFKRSDLTTTQFTYSIFNISANPYSECCRLIGTSPGITQSKNGSTQSPSNITGLDQHFFFLFPSNPLVKNNRVLMRISKI